MQTTGGAFSAGNPVRVLNTKYYAGSTPRGLNLRSYDVAADGRFLMIKEEPTAAPSAPASMVVVVNWAEELKAALPGK